MVGLNDGVAALAAALVGALAMRGFYQLLKSTDSLGIAHQHLEWAFVYAGAVVGLIATALITAVSPVWDAVPIVLFGIFGAFLGAVAYDILPSRITRLGVVPFLICSSLFGAAGGAILALSK